MRYVAAYLLAYLSGNEHPKAADVKKILSSVGVETNEADLKRLFAELEGKVGNHMHIHRPQFCFCKSFLHPIFRM